MVELERLIGEEREIMVTTFPAKRAELEVRADPSYPGAVDLSSRATRERSKGDPLR